MWSSNVDQWSVILVGVVITGKYSVVNIDLSPVIYDSLFSLFNSSVMSASLVAKMSMAACGCVFS